MDDDDDADIQSALLVKDTSVAVVMINVKQGVCYHSCCFISNKSWIAGLMIFTVHRRCAVISLCVGVWE